jgi:hypothetical protein
MLSLCPAEISLLARHSVNDDPRLIRRNGQPLRAGIADTAQGAAGGDSIGTGGNIGEAVIARSIGNHAGNLCAGTVQQGNRRAGSHSASL